MDPASMINICALCFLSTLPNALEDEIAMKYDLGKTLADAIDFVQARTNRSRERELVERLAKGRRTALGMNALTTNTAPAEANFQDCPDIVNQLINALNAAKKSGPKDRGRSTTRQGSTPTRSPGQSRSPSPAGNRKRPDPKSGTCWWCQKPGHTKQNCDAYKKHCADNNIDPKGYSGGRTRVSAVKSQNSAAASAKSGDSDTESDHSAESGERGVSMFACVPQASGWTKVKQGPAATIVASPPKKTAPGVRNAFRALQNLDEEEDDEAAMMSHLSSISHKMSVSSKKKSQKQRRRDKLIQRSLPAGMTTNYEHAVKVMANLQKEQPLGENDDEEWALVDSGSGVHGNNPNRHLKGIPVTKTERRLNCTTADGSPMLGTGGVQRTTFTTDEGDDCEVEFDELPVAFPILSVKLLASKSHSVLFDDDFDGGGCITHKINGRKSRIVEREGVYFIRMKKIRPTKPKPEPRTKKLFVRPGQIS